MACSPDGRPPACILASTCDQAPASGVAAEFDAVHSVARAREVGSLSDILAPGMLRERLIGSLEASLRGE